MNIEETTKLLKGKHTIDTIETDLHLTRGSALNLVSRLKKAGYLQTSGGGRQKRIYTISPRKIVRPEKDMFTMINKYSKMKLVASFRHAAYGDYTRENALIDAILTRSVRTIQASIFLFNHIRDWKKLHALARKKDIEQEVGALYLAARFITKTRRMPKNILDSMKMNVKKKGFLIMTWKTNVPALKKIEEEWNVGLPFLNGDVEELR